MCRVIFSHIIFFEQYLWGGGGSVVRGARQFQFLYNISITQLSPIVMFWNQKASASVSKNHPKPHVIIMTCTCLYHNYMQNLHFAILDLFWTDHILILQNLLSFKFAPESWKNFYVKELEKLCQELELIDFHGGKTQSIRKKVTTLLQLHVTLHLYYV